MELWDPYKLSLPTILFELKAENKAFILLQVIQQAKNK
jgi:hypothetical protein